MTGDPSSAPGGAAEELICRYLVERGWTILGRRVRVGRYEVDIVAQLGATAAMVEVRGRREGGWVSPLDSIDWKKQRRLANAARAVWKRYFAHDERVQTLRIDVAAVTWTASGEPLIEVVEGAVMS